MEATASKTKRIHIFTNKAAKVSINPQISTRKRKRSRFFSDFLKRPIYFWDLLLSFENCPFLYLLATPSKCYSRFWYIWHFRI